RRASRLSSGAGPRWHPRVRAVRATTSRRAPGNASRENLREGERLPGRRPVCRAPGRGCRGGCSLSAGGSFLAGRPARGSNAPQPEPPAMKKPLHVALIGQKFMGRAHSNAWGQVNRFFDLPLVARMDSVAGRDAAELAAFAENWGWRKATTDWR